MLPARPAARAAGAARCRAAARAAGAALRHVAPRAAGMAAAVAVAAAAGAPPAAEAAPRRPPRVEAVLAHLAAHPMTVGSQAMQYDASPTTPLPPCAQGLAPEHVLPPSRAAGAPLREHLGRVIAGALLAAVGGLDAAHNAVTPLCWGSWTSYAGAPVPGSAAAADAALVHAIVHRQEGLCDGEFGSGFSNATYWYRAAGDHPIWPALLQEAKRLAAGTPAEAHVARHGGAWNPTRFVGLCADLAGARDPPDAALLRFAEGVMAAELRLLLDHCYARLPRPRRCLRTAARNEGAGLSRDGAPGGSSSDGTARGAGASNGSSSEAGAAVPGPGYAVAPHRPDLPPATNAPARLRKQQRRSDLAEQPVAPSRQQPQRPSAAGAAAGPAEPARPAAARPSKPTAAARPQAEAAAGHPRPQADPGRAFMRAGMPRGLWVLPLAAAASAPPAPPPVAPDEPEALLEVLRAMPPPRRRLVVFKGGGYVYDAMDALIADAGLGHVVRLTNLMRKAGCVLAKAAWDNGRAVSLAQHRAAAANARVPFLLIERLEPEALVAALRPALVAKGIVVERGSAARAPRGGNDGGG
ncbi:hypothetical protein HT031_006007 [Scenedesmus sp. PABB004]|nr:hypothetical protein HT031_006007 [Scenedesmus sp. PABB004]